MATASSFSVLLIKNTNTRSKCTSGFVFCFVKTGLARNRSFDSYGNVLSFFIYRYISLKFYCIDSWWSNRLQRFYSNYFYMMRHNIIKWLLEIKYIFLCSTSKIKFNADVRTNTHWVHNVLWKSDAPFCQSFTNISYISQSTSKNINQITMNEQINTTMLYIHIHMKTYQAIDKSSKSSTNVSCRELHQNETHYNNKNSTREKQTACTHLA